MNLVRVIRCAVHISFVRESTDGAAPGVAGLDAREGWAARATVRRHARDAASPALGAPTARFAATAPRTPRVHGTVLSRKLLVKRVAPSLGCRTHDAVHICVARCRCQSDGITAASAEELARTQIPRGVHLVRVKRCAVAIPVAYEPRMDYSSRSGQE